MFNNDAATSRSQQDKTRSSSCLGESDLPIGKAAAFSDVRRSLALQWGGVFKFLETFYHQPCRGATDNEAASNSCVKHALICQSQTFVALQGLWLRHNTKSSLGWEVAPKINKAWKRRNYKHSAMRNEEKPSKQSVACSIFNSFPAWHKDGCQTTEETNGGMTEEWKKDEGVLTWDHRGIFHSRRGEIHTQPHTNRFVEYIYDKVLKVVLFSKAHPQTVDVQVQTCSREVQQRGSYWDRFTIWAPKTNLRHHGDRRNRMKYSASWPPGRLCPWLTVREVSSHNNAAFARRRLSGFSLVERDLAQIPILNRMTLVTNLSWPLVYFERFQRKKLKLIL